MTWNKAWGALCMFAMGLLGTQACYQPLHLELLPALLFGGFGIAFLRRDW